MSAINRISVIGLVAAAARWGGPQIPAAGRAAQASRFPRRVLGSTADIAAVCFEAGGGWLCAATGSWVFHEDGDGFESLTREGGREVEEGISLCDLSS